MRSKGAQAWIFFFFPVFGIVGGGCLIFEEINHRPRAKVEVDGGETSHHRGEEVTVKAVLGDDEDAPESLVASWEVAFRGAKATLHLTTDHTLVSLGRSVDGGRGDGGVPADGGGPVVAGEGATLKFTLPRDERLGGSYEVDVSLRVRDPRGATTRVVKTLTVVNQAPEAKIILLGGDPPPPTLFRHVLHVASGALSVDPDDDLAEGSDDSDLACAQGKVMTRWEAVSPPKSAYLRWRVIPCRPGQILDKLAWQLPPSGVPTTVTLRLVLRDRWGAEARVERRFAVGSDATPCIDGALPSIEGASGAPAKVVMVARGDPSLGVAGVLRVMADGQAIRGVPEAQSYRWLVAEKPTGPYQVLVARGGPRLTLSGLLPGDRHYVRVIVAKDEVGLTALALGGCGVATPFCQHAPGLVPGCYQWITWEVRGR